MAGKKWNISPNNGKESPMSIWDPTYKKGKKNPQIQYDYKEDKTNPPLDFQSLRNYYYSNRDALYTYITDLYQNYFMYNQPRAAQLKEDNEEWRSNIKSPLTYMFQTSVYNMVLDADIRFIAIDRTNKYEWICDELLDWMDYMFNTSQSRKNFFDAVFDTILLGYWQFKISYKYTEEEVIFKDKFWRDVKKTITKDYPYIKYVSPYNLIFDRWGRSLDENRFIIERRLLASASVENEYKIYWLKLKQEELTKHPYYVDYMDYDAVKMYMPYYNSSEWRNILEDNTYNITNKLMECFELYTKHTVSIWINWVFHWTFPTVWPYKTYSYKVMTFKKTPWSYQGIGIWYIVKPLQDVYDQVLNLRLDNVKLALNKTFLMDAGATIFGNQTHIKLKPWALIRVKNFDLIKELPISEVKQSAYQEVDSLFWISQAMTGISSQYLWFQQKVERTSWGAEMLQNAPQAQLKPMLDSIIEVMGDTMKQMIILSLVYTDKATFDRVLWPNNQLKDLDPMIVLQDFDFDFEMLSEKSKNETVKRQQLMTLLQMMPSMVSAAWTPLLDAKDIAVKLLRSFNLDEDTLMNPEKMIQLIQDQMKIQQAQQAMQPQQPQVPWQPWWQPWWQQLPTANSKQPNWKDMQSAMANLQQLWWWVSWSMTTNPQGINTSQ